MKSYLSNKLSIYQEKILCSSQLLHVFLKYIDWIKIHGSFVEDIMMGRVVCHGFRNSPPTASMQGWKRLIQYYRMSKLFPIVYVIRFLPKIIHIRVMVHRYWIKCSLFLYYSNCSSEKVFVIIIFYHRFCKIAAIWDKRFFVTCYIRCGLVSKLLSHSILLLYADSKIWQNVIHPYVSIG